MHGLAMLPIVVVLVVAGTLVPWAAHAQNAGATQLPETPRAEQQFQQLNNNLSQQMQQQQYQQQNSLELLRLRQQQYQQQITPPLPQPSSPGCCRR